MANSSSIKKVLPIEDHSKINIFDYFTTKFSIWFECKLCSEKIKEQDNSKLYRHINEKHNQQHDVHEYIQESWTVTEHFIETLETIYICKICKKEFNMSHNLQEHAISHTIEEFNKKISLSNYSENSEASCSSHAGAASSFRGTSSSSRGTTSNSSMQAITDHTDNIWRYFTITGQFVQCNNCNKVFKQSTSLKTLGKHLWKMHETEGIETYRWTERYYTCINTYQCILCNWIISLVPENAEVTLLHHMKTEHAYEACLSAVFRRDRFSCETVLQSQTSQKQSEKQIEEHIEQQIEEQSSSSQRTSASNREQSSTSQRTSASNQEQSSTSQRTSAFNQEQSSTSQRTSASNREQPSTSQRTSAFNQVASVNSRVQLRPLDRLYIQNERQYRVYMYVFNSIVGELSTRYRRITENMRIGIDNRFRGRENLLNLFNYVMIRHMHDRRASFLSILDSLRHFLQTIRTYSEMQTILQWLCDVGALLPLSLGEITDDYWNPYNELD